MSTIKANTLLHSDGSTTTQPSIPALAPAMAKAWVRINGMNTVSIYSSYNVSSITDVQTGNYQANFTTALNGNYCGFSSTSQQVTWGGNNTGNEVYIVNQSVMGATHYENGILTDTGNIHILAFSN